MCTVDCLSIVILWEKAASLVAHTVHCWLELVEGTSRSSKSLHQMQGRLGLSWRDLSRSCLRMIGPEAGATDEENRVMEKRQEEKSDLEGVGAQEVSDICNLHTPRLARLVANWRW